MKTFAFVCALVAVSALAVSTASAADRPASVSQATLSSMGLGGIQPLSDIEGRAIRGKGSFAIVSGSGHSQIGPNFNNSNYAAGASHLIGGSSANGGNVTGVSTVLGVGPFHASLSVTTFGGSFASAH